MKITIPVGPDGKPTEVEVPDEQITAQGFQPTATFETELTRRGLSIAKKAGFVKLDELTPEQIKTLAESKGIKFETPVDPGDTAQAIKQAVDRNRSEWEQRELTPLQTKLAKQEEAEQELLQGKLHGEIIAAAAAAGVEKSLLKAPTKNSVAPIVSILASAFAYDTDTKSFLVLSDDGEGFAFSDKPSQDHPYKDVDEMVAQWATNKENAKFIEVTSQRGPNLQGVVGGGRGGAAGPVHIAKSDSRDLRKLNAAKAEAAKRGLDWANGGVVVDD